MAPHKIGAAVSTLVFILLIGCAEPGAPIRAVYLDDVAAPRRHATPRRRTPSSDLPAIDPAALCKTRGRVLEDAPETHDICVDDERGALREMRASWHAFSAKDREACMALNGGVSPSYVEMLTCLEMTRKTPTLNADALATIKRAEEALGSATPRP